MLISSCALTNSRSCQLWQKSFIVFVPECLLFVAGDQLQRCLLLQSTLLSEVSAAYVSCSFDDANNFLNRPTPARTSHRRAHQNRRQRHRQQNGADFQLLNSTSSGALRYSRDVSGLLPLTWSFPTRPSACRCLSEGFGSRCRYHLSLD